MGANVAASDRELHLMTQPRLLDGYVYQPVLVGGGWWITRDGPWRPGQPDRIVATCTTEADAKLVCVALNLTA